MRKDAYLVEVASGGSRFVNAVLGGDGAVTLSASSWDLLLTEGGGLERWRVRIIDRFMGPGHCHSAWDWHVAHGLISDTDEAN